MCEIVDLGDYRQGLTELEDALKSLRDLQELCADAMAAKGLDRGGPSIFEFSVAVHRALKGTKWNVRFYRSSDLGP
jgi:hypothetical protein